MNLINQLSTALRATVNDLLAEEPTAPREHTARLLKTADQRVAKLNEQLAMAVAREKRAEQDWRDARAQAEALEAEANRAVLNKQDELARVKLAQLNQTQTRLLRLSERWKSYAATSEKLHIEIQDLQTQLGEARRRLLQAGEHEGNTSSLENLQQTRCQQHRETEQVQEELKASVEQTAQREDNVKARGELDQTRITDLLKKRDQGQSSQGS